MASKIAGRGTAEERAYHDHHILVPQLEVRDKRVSLGSLSAERRELLDRRVEEFRQKMVRFLAKDLFDYSGPDALYLKTYMLERGDGLHLQRRCYAVEEDRPLLDAADFEVQPGKMLCIIKKDWVWQDDAIAWIDLARLGLSLDGEPCLELSRLYDVFMDRSSE